MSDADNAELFICSFCEQQLKITKHHIGRRIKCPKCARAVYLHPNRGQVIDPLLSSNWYYQRPRLLVGSDNVGPISDDQFVKLIRAGEIQTDTEISSPQLTKDQWLPAGRLNVSIIQERIEQRKAEQERRARDEGRQRESTARKEEQKREIAAHNMQLLCRAVTTAIADGRITLREREQLGSFARAAKIPEAELNSILHSEATPLLEALIEQILDDGILDPNEKQRISDFATGLGVVLSLTPDQYRRLELCELASQLANGTFSAGTIENTEVVLGTGETPFALVNVDWLEVVQQKKPVGIALGDDHYLKPVASGDCLLTNKRLVLMGKFTSKKASLSSVERVRRYTDGVFCNKSTGKSIFLKPAQHDVQWDRFSMLVEYAVSSQPVLGLDPTDAFIPGSLFDFEYDVGNPPVTLEWTEPSAEPRYTFRVVGDHVGDRAHWIEQTTLGDAVHLIREPDNAYDTNAVAVFDSAQHQLGYLKQEVAAWFGPMIDRGYDFRSQAFRKPSSGGLIVAVFEC